MASTRHLATMDVGCTADTHSFERWDISQASVVRRCGCALMRLFQTAGCEYSSGHARWCTLPAIRRWLCARPGRMDSTRRLLFTRRGRAEHALMRGDCTGGSGVQLAPRGSLLSWTVASLGGWTPTAGTLKMNPLRLGATRAPLWGAGAAPRAVLTLLGRSVVCPLSCQVPLPVFQSFDMKDHSTHQSTLAGV